MNTTPRWLFRWEITIKRPPTPCHHQASSYWHAFPLAWLTRSPAPSHPHSFRWTGSQVVIGESNGGFFDCRFEKWGNERTVGTLTFNTNHSHGVSFLKLALLSSTNPSAYAVSNPRKSAQPVHNKAPKWRDLWQPIKRTPLPKYFSENENWGSPVYPSFKFSWER